MYNYSILPLLSRLRRGPYCGLVPTTHAQGQLNWFLDLGSAVVWRRPATSPHYCPVPGLELHNIWRKGGCGDVCIDRVLA